MKGPCDDQQRGHLHVVNEPGEHSPEHGGDGRLLVTHDEPLNGRQDLIQKGRWIHGIRPCLYIRTERAFAGACPCPMRTSCVNQLIKFCSTAFELLCFLHPHSLIFERMEGRKSSNHLRVIIWLGIAPQCSEVIPMVLLA